MVNCSVQNSIHMELRMPTAYLPFKLDEFYISKGVFRFLSQFLTQLCVMYFNKDEKNNSIISTT